MKFKQVKFPIHAMLMCTLIIFFSCKSAKITVTDCPVADITVTESTRIATQAGSQWTLVTVITVKCKGQVVNGAEIKAEFWWPDSEFIKKTNDQGQITIRKNGSGAKPSGKTFEVTIKGNDGEKPTTFTIP